jgi:nucleotide-binding universal stress UspA family protein
MLLPDEPGMAAPRRVGSIFHPSDFSEGSEVAFAHALKIALLAQADLNVLHVSEREDRSWTAFPGVRQMLERWHVLPPGSPPSAVPSLGIEVRKVLTTSSDPVAASLAYLERHATDLVVLATHRRNGRAAWLSKAVAEPLARESGLMTLFVPAGVEGFVSRADGSVSLWKVLIPVAQDPSPDGAIEAASRMALALRGEAVTFTLLYVGQPADMPLASFEERDGWTWRPMATAGGDVVDTILAVAKETTADLIAMSTKGHHGFLDALRGSTTERVLRHARCPVLAVPAGQQTSS